MRNRIEGKDTWKAEGYTCRILNHGSHYCGYVTVPKSHPLAGPRRENEFHPDVADLVVHGGVTFYSETSDGWTFGFDTMHPGDEKNESFVRGQCELLAGQLRREQTEWEERK